MNVSYREATALGEVKTVGKSRKATVWIARKDRGKNKREVV